MLALLLGALSLFAAAPAPAQSVPTNVLTNGILDPHSLTVTPGNEKLDLTWNTGSSSVEGHWVQYKRRTDTAWTTSTSTLSGTAASHSITGLTGGTLYDVRIFGTLTSGGTLYRGIFVTGSGTPTGTSAELSVTATPACGSTVSDMSKQPFWHLNLTPAPATEQAVDYSPVNSGGVPLGGEPKWNGHLSIRAPSGKSIESPRSQTFAELRRNFPGFAGFKWRLRDDHSIEASCNWQFDDGGDGGGTQPEPDPQPTPNTGGGTPTGGGGSPSGGGGGGSGPAQSSDASLNTLEIGGDSLDLDPDTDTYTRDAYGEKRLTLTPTASDRRARITVNGERVRSGRPHTVTLEDDGVTEIKIVVTAEDGTTRTYTLTVMSCHAEERKILEMFYHSTQGDMWEQSGGWNTEDDLNIWHGVRTDEDGNVISLRLPDNGLSGDIPSALLCFDELSGLLELALWDNEGLSGEVPDDLVPAVERAALRDVAVALNLNPGWFDDYEDPFSFSDWHEGVTTDDDGRVTELDFTGEDITGEIPGSVFELKRLTVIERGCGVTLEVEAPGRVSVTPLPEGCSDASLRNIEISPGELEFDPMNRSYEVPVGYGPESVTVTPTASESEAVITVNGETVQSGSPSTVALEDDGETEIEIVVTAEDGMTTRTYEITVTRCGADDIWALSRFYEAVGGEGWNDNTNWNSQEPLDRWFGVGTDEDGRVISLDLEGNGLSGKTPRELVCLSEIKELALWDNELSGEVPQELALAVERAVLRDVAEALSLNPGWFDDYEDPFNFSDWHMGVTTDDDERVTELDFTGEDITGEIPGSVFELERLTAIETGCEVTLEVEAPERVSVMPDECPEETPPEDMEEMEEEEMAASRGGGCALSQGDSSVSGFGLFLVTILVFAVLGRKRYRE